ncbi:MAG: hypothetical protein J5I90_14720 [Caldilineales bacterium]|nr:hypothetical protein [Caldilineales bacterium]
MYPPMLYSTVSISLPRNDINQRHQPDTMLYDYNARWYDPAIGRFLAADTIVPQPGNPQSLNRYAYSSKNRVTR